MRDDDIETSLKIVIVGNGAVGKSSMIQRFCKGVFSLNYKMTIGVDFLERVIRVNGARVHLMLWDTAGQEEFDALTKAYYRVSDGCVLAFSTTDVQSFEAIEKWKKKVEFECGPIPMVLVQNKSDLMEESRVSPQSVERLAKNLNLPVFQTSSKNNFNIDKVFHSLAAACLDSASTLESSSSGELDSVASASIRPAAALLKYTNAFVRRKKEKSFRQRITGISSSSSPSFEECQKRNMITAVSSSSRNSSLVQRKPHPGHHLQQQQKSLQLQRRPVRIPAAPVMPVTSPVILLHHPFHHHQQQQQQHRHQPQHLRLHPHHHWSYMQHRKLEFRKKPSPSCWIL